MVKKLFKHEFMALSRMLVPMYVILTGIAIVSRIIFAFENDSVAYSIISTMAIAVLVIGIITSLVYTSVACIIRFYKNLFTKEGYLTFTLPVSVEAHLGTKLLSAVVADIVSLVVIFGAFCIATSGELLVELFKAAGYIFSLAAKVLDHHLPLYIMEYILMFVVMMVTGFLLFYACMCIGQLAKRSRVLLALGVYFGYYYLTQIIVTIAMVMMTFFADTPLFEGIIKWIDRNPFETVHIALLGTTLITAALGTAYYFIARFIMKKKLNLE